jgi:hypothetical protein
MKRWWLAKDVSEELLRLAFWIGSGEYGKEEIVKVLKARAGEIGKGTVEVKPMPIQVAQVTQPISPTPTFMAPVEEKHNWIDKTLLLLIGVGVCVVLSIAISEVWEVFLDFGLE